MGNWTNFLEPSVTYQVFGAISIGLITGGFGITLSHELIHRPKKMGDWIRSAIIVASVLQYF